MVRRLRYCQKLLVDSLQRIHPLLKLDIVGGELGLGKHEQGGIGELWDSYLGICLSQLFFDILLSASGEWGESRAAGHQYGLLPITWSDSSLT